MTENLEPCPFCGNKAQRRSTTFDNSAVRVTCSICTASTDFYPNNDYPAAERYWNSRPIEAALKAEIEALKDQIEEMKERDEALLNDSVRINTKINIADAINDTLRDKLSALKTENERLKRQEYRNCDAIIKLRDNLKAANKKLDAVDDLLEKISIWFWKNTGMPEPTWTDDYKNVCDLFDPPLEVEK